MTFLETIVGIIALALLISVIILARLAGRIGRAADDVGIAARRAAELAPAARNLLESGRAELEALRALSSTATGVADDVRSVTSHASSVTTEVLQGLENGVLGRYRAVFAGARAGMDALRHFRSGNGHAEADEFERAER